MSSIQKTVKPTQKTLGQILQAAREDRQLSIHDITQRLLLNKQVIVDIENDDYGKIPAKVYAEGYLRAYAKLLNLSVDDVLNNFRSLDLYQEDYSEVASPSYKCGGNFFAKCRTVLSNKLILWDILGLAILLLLIGGAVFFMKEKAKIAGTKAAYDGVNKNVIQQYSEGSGSYPLESISITKDLPVKVQPDDKNQSSSSL